MSITRVSDNQTYAFATSRTQRLQVTLRQLQEQIASGRRLLTPDQDPLAAGQTVRQTADLASLAQWQESSRFGDDVLAAQDDALGRAQEVLVEADLTAASQSSPLSAADVEAAREQVHGMLQQLTVVANGELAGRRLFGGLALDAPPPFADPDTTGWTAATAYTGSTQDFEVTIGAGQRVRITTQGDQVFGDALQALQDLDDALANGDDLGPVRDAIEAARQGLGAERSSVAARQVQLQNRDSDTADLILQTKQARARLTDADFVDTVSQLAQTQTALQALLAAVARISDTSLVNLLQL